VLIPVLYVMVQSVRERMKSWLFGVRSDEPC